MHPEREAAPLADDVLWALEHTTGDYLGQDGFEAIHSYQEEHHRFDLVLPGGRRYQLTLYLPEEVTRHESIKALWPDGEGDDVG